MQANISKLIYNLDSTIQFLNPLLPLANCHMVEFLTLNHWEQLLPTPLRKVLDTWSLDEALDRFWRAAEKDYSDNSEISKWIQTAQSHYVKVDNDYCLSTEQLQDRIKAWGGDLQPEIKVTEFMTDKKSYEVQTMSSVVSALHAVCRATCCVEAGGGRGYLPAALSLGYGVPSLTVDCNPHVLRAAETRGRIIQKQWHAIAKRIKNGIEERISRSIDTNLHRFAQAFVTKDTDLAAIVREKYPETTGGVKLLLTGLHTCGDLGPACLRLFSQQASTAALVNVPCCYHLLTEHIPSDVMFHNCYTQPATEGFPMSEHLRGYNIGRNARMLAAQSIDRVVSGHQMPSVSLLYRAVLQAIIKENIPEYKIKEGKLKRMSSKCQNFQQYFKMADEILTLNLYDKLSVKYFENIEKDIASQWKKLVLFYLVRLCLAQVIEGVILLDRLMFLFERGFDKAYLVKMFDPVLSPRCHSIVAVR